MIGPIPYFLAPSWDDYRYPSEEGADDGAQVLAVPQSPSTHEVALEKWVARFLERIEAGERDLERYRILAEKDAGTESGNGPEVAAPHAP